MVYNQVTPKRKDDLMNAKLVEMLEAALKHMESSIYWFDQSQDDENSWQWVMSKEHDDKARGILEAYQIITGIRVDPLTIGIRAEIGTIKEHHQELK